MAHPRSGLGVTLALVLRATCLYHLTFNYVPDHRRIQAAALLTGGFAIASIVALAWRGVATWQGTALLAIGLLVGTWTIGAVLAVAQSNSFEAVRTVLPLVLGVALLRFPQALSKRLIAWCGTAIIVFATLIGVLSNPVHLGNAARLRPFTGGVENTAHASSYLVSVAILMVYATYHQVHWRPWVGRSVIAAGLGVMLGYRVLTPLVMLGVLFVLHVLSERSFTTTQRLALLMLVVTLAAVVATDRVTVEVKTQRGVTANTISSGRLGVWTEWLTLISHRSRSQLLLGTGPGTAVLTTHEWWWAAKNAHNDFFDLVFEFGVLGLCAVLWLLLAIRRALGRRGWPVIGYFLIGSMLSNGLLGRPLIQGLFWFAAAQMIARPATLRAGRQLPTPQYALAGIE